MRSKLLWINKLFFLPLVVLTCAAMDIASNAAPSSATGAPDEVDCTTSGCHETYAVNSGPGSVSIMPDASLLNYNPGQTYTISLAVNQAALIRFGFQMVALNDADQTNAGTFMPIDGSRNQIVPGYDNKADRRYITYTFKSTSAINTPGTGSWTFKWTAPSTNVGPITFYAAGIAANNDGMDMGDYCYTTSLKIKPAVTTPSDFTITYCNPIKDQINLAYSLPEASTIKIDLIDLQGKVVEQLYSNDQDKGNYKLTLPLANWYKGGIYFLRFDRDGKVTNKKIFIAN